MTIPRSWHVTEIREKANCRNEPMEVTWIAIIASVCMGIGGVLIFVFAVKKNYFRDLEDAKYQMFWSEVAAVVLMNGRLEKIPAVLALARRTMRIIRQNLFWAFFYNTMGIVLAVMGVLNPILAAAAMLLSSASVVGNTMRLTRQDTPLR